MAGRYKLVSMSTTVEAAIADGYSELETLKTELDEVIEEASGSNRENTQRIQTLSETRDTLDSASVDSPPDVPDVIKEIHVDYRENKVIRGRYGKSRSIRRDDACSMLTGAKDAIEGFISNGEVPDDDKVGLTGLVDALEEMVNNVEGCEFPGMYG